MTSEPVREPDAAEPVVKPSTEPETPAQAELDGAVAATSAGSDQAVAATLGGEDATAACRRAAGR